ncbi:MAG: protein kinase, partial [Anaerolineales bacterium]|nr:protein kinase [Anaerolineales bacterium]
IKPANVLLDEDQNAYLADFGIAKNLEQVHKESLTAGGAIVGSPAYISPEQIKAEPVQPQSDIYCFGIMLFEMLTGRQPFPGPTPVAYIHQHLNDHPPSLREFNTDLPAALDVIVQRATAKNLADRYASITAMLRDLEQAFPQTVVLTHLAAPINGETAVYTRLDTAELAALENPYRGLRSFSEADADNFFGRDTLVQELLGFMSDGADLERFVAVVGPSGGGKSSVVKAGVIPTIRRGGLPDSEHWFIVDLTPGTHPWEEVEAALLRIAVNPPNSLLAQLRDGNRGLLRAVQRVLPADEKTELVMVIDQFEELFTLVEDEAVRTHFLESLVTAVLDSRSRLRVIITMRADFTDRPLNYVDFGEMMRRRTAFILPLTPDELTQAITRPVEQLGLQMEPRLVSTITAEVGQQPGMLPLLQYALTELFEQREGQVITLKMYHATGGVTGALARRADEIFESLDPASQMTARQLFLRLITLGEGVEDTRRRVLQEELLQLGSSSGNRSLIPAVLETFGRHRLLTFDHDPVTRSPTVEVAHEALLREWPRLRQWLADSRDDIRQQRLLAEAARLWQTNGRDDSYLLLGSRLTAFEAWVQTTTVKLTADEQTFLHASLIARDDQQAAEEERQRRELETAQQLGEEQSRRAEEQSAAAQSLRQRAYFLTGAVVIAAVLALAAVGFARSSTNNASLAATRASEALYNSNLAAANEAEAIANANIAATREVEANKEREEAQREANIRATAEAEAEIQREEAQNSERAAQEAYSLSLAANARQALEANNTELALLLALAANRIENPPLAAWQALIDVAYAPAASKEILFQNNIPLSFDLMPNGTHVLVGTNNGELQLYNLETKSIITTLRGHEGSVMSVAVNTDGTQALSGDSNGTAILWDLESGQLIHRMSGHSDAVEALDFLPDETRAITGVNSVNAPGELTIWNLKSGQMISRFGNTIDQNRYGIRSLAVLPNSNTVLVGINRANIADAPQFILWDFEKEEIVQSFQTATGFSISDIAISPDQQYILLASFDNNIYLLDLASNEIVRELRGHGADVSSVAFSPDGKTAVSGSRDDSIIWWEVKSGRILNHFEGHAEDIRQIGFSNL